MLSNVAILAVVAMTIAFFLMGGFFHSEQDTSSIPPAPDVELAEKPVAPANLAGNHANASEAVKATGQEPVVRSDEQGTKLNLQGYELIQQQKFKEAEPVLRHAVESFPEGTTAVAYKYSLYNLGHVLRRNGKLKEAIPYLEKVVKMDPEWSKAQSELERAKSQVQQATAAAAQISQL
jgi:TolA-binding protein